MKEEDAPNEAHARHEAARRWVGAVNNWKRLGEWRFEVCRDPHALGGLLATLVTSPEAPGT